MNSLDVSTGNMTKREDGAAEADGNTATVIIILIINTIIMLFICIGNLFTIMAVCTVPALRTTPNMYIVSLAVADLMIGLMIPVFASDVYPPYEALLSRNKYMCLARISLMYSFVISSIFSMVAIAFDRFLFIRYPLMYDSVYSEGKAGMIIAFTWTVSFLMGTPPLYWNSWDGDGIRPCNSFLVLAKHYQVTLVSSAYFFCCTVTAVFYWFILKTALDHQRRSVQLFSNKPTKVSWWRRSEKRGVKMLIIVFVAFLVCWTPNILLAVFAHGTDISRNIVRMFSMVGYMHSGFNFIIYAFKNKKFRRAFHNFARCPMKQPDSRMYDTYISYNPNSTPTGTYSI